MIGMTADLPVRDTPVMTFRAPSSNRIRWGANARFRGQRMSSFSWKYIGSESHPENCCGFEQTDLGQPRAELLCRRSELSNLFCPLVSRHHLRYRKNLSRDVDDQQPRMDSSLERRDRERPELAGTVVDRIQEIFTPSRGELLAKRTKAGRGPRTDCKASSFLVKENR